VPGKEAGGVRNTNTPAAAGEEEKKRERSVGGGGTRTDRDRSRLRGKLLTSVRSCPSRVTRGRGGSSVAAAAWAQRTIPDVRRDDQWSQVASAGARRYWMLGSWSGAGFVVTSNVSRAQFIVGNGHSISGSL
jgi:hypothetical protein